MIPDPTQPADRSNGASTPHENTDDIEVISVPIRELPTLQLPPARTIAIAAVALFVLVILVTAGIYLQRLLENTIPLDKEGKVNISQILKNHPEPEDRYQMAIRFFGDEDLQGIKRKYRNQAGYLLLKVNAKAGHAYSAFALAEFYDPNHWEGGSKPSNAEGVINRCHPRQAALMYGIAAANGHPAAKQALEALPKDSSAFHTLPCSRN